MTSSNPKVLLWSTKNTLTDGNSLRFVKLRHPRSRTSALYLLNAKSELQEIVNLDDGYRSWFFENHVVSDKCSMRICTPIDKLFLVLPYLEKSSNFSPLVDLISDEDFPSNHEVFAANTNVSVICDTKKAAGLDVYRLNKDKTLQWLLKKLEHLVKIITEINLDTSMGKFSANYKEVSEAAVEDLKRFAHGIISEYISSDLSNRLLEACGISNQVDTFATPKKRSLEEDKASVSPKRAKHNPLKEPTEDYSKSGNKPRTGGKVDTSKLSNAQKKLINSSKKGMKNIQSFFGKQK